MGDFSRRAAMEVIDAIRKHPDVTDTNVGDLISRQAAIDALEKCYTCKHVYQRIDDADTMYCRCRKGCMYEEAEIRRSNHDSPRYEG